MAKKIRLDQLVVQRGLAESLAKAQALIMAKEVLIAGTPHTKAGELVVPDADLTIAQALPYASRGGYKLAHALDSFRLSPAGLIALDVGASTGGFTDVLLQRGAGHVYAVDVGYGLINWRLRQDPRVVVLDRTNIRFLERLPSGAEPPNRRTAEPPSETRDKETRRQGDKEIAGLSNSSTISNLQSPISNSQPSSTVHRPSSILADCATIDVSFISLRLVLPAVKRLIAPEAWVVALVKPQFEAEVQDVSRGEGVIRDPAIHRAVLREVLGFAAGEGLYLAGLTRSPVTGPAGNIEFLAWLAQQETALRLDSAIEAAMAG
jgi:23S rRNA (cytidine1920-2'-O)/16S rRNA (cytidine1409-2'-O)-methyltransferase